MKEDRDDDYNISGHPVGPQCIISVKQTQSVRDVIRTVMEEPINHWKTSEVYTGK